MPVDRLEVLAGVRKVRSIVRTHFFNHSRSSKVVLVNEIDCNRIAVDLAPRVRKLHFCGFLVSGNVFP